MNEIRIRKDQNIEKTFKIIPDSDLFDNYAFEKNVHKKNTEYIKKTSYHLTELVIEDFDGTFIDTINLFYTKIEFKSNKKDEIDKTHVIYPIGFKIKDIFKFAYHLHYKKDKKPWYTRDEELFVKKIMNIESDKESELLGFDKHYNFCSLQPNKLVRDNHANFANSLVCYYYFYSHESLDNEIKKLSSENYLRLFIDYYMHSGSLHVEVFKKIIFKFDEPKSLEECLELDLESKKEENQYFNIVKYHEVRCMRDIIKRKLGMKKQSYLKDHYSYIIANHRDYNEVINHIPIFAYKNLYFTDWYNGLGNEIYESYRHKRCLLTFQNVKYMNQKRIDNDRSIYENSYVENFLGSYYRYYKKSDDHKDFNRELNNVNKNIKNGIRFWEDEYDISDDELSK